MAFSQQMQTLPSIGGGGLLAKAKALRGGGAAAATTQQQPAAAVAAVPVPTTVQQEFSGPNYNYFQPGAVPAAAAAPGAVPVQQQYAVMPTAGAYPSLPTLAAGAYPAVPGGYAAVPGAEAAAFGQQQVAVPQQAPVDPVATAAAAGLASSGINVVTSTPVVLEVSEPW